MALPLNKKCIPPLLLLPLQNVPLAFHFQCTCWALFSKEMQATVESKETNVPIRPLLRYCDIRLV